MQWNVRKIKSDKIQGDEGILLNGMDVLVATNGAILNLNLSFMKILAIIDMITT